jgi:hypothetical protein
MIIGRIPQDDKEYFRLRKEYEESQARFMKEKGYKSFEDIPFIEIETFAMFRERTRRDK